jgi:DNA-binding CsgD family transcriptional regulator
MRQKLDIINASAYQYQLATQQPFIEICEPLFKLGIKYFAYYKLFNNGQYLSLMNHLPYLKAYLSNIKNNGFTFTQKLEAIKARRSSSYLLLPTDLRLFDKKKDPIMHLQYDFNLWNGFYIYKGRRSDSIECYCFVGERHETFLPSFCINNLALLEQFCQYFNEKAKDLIDCTERSKLGSFLQHSDLTHISQDAYCMEKIEQFLQETQLQRRFLKTHIGDVPLSRREEQCLHYLSLGKTAKEIARIFDLSPRAIEFYIYKLKQKSGLNRNELLIAFARGKTLV